VAQRLLSGYVLPGFAVGRLIDRAIEMEALQQLIELQARDTCELDNTRAYDAGQKEIARADPSGLANIAREGDLAARLHRL